MTRIRRAALAAAFVVALAAAAPAEADPGSSPFDNVLGVLGKGFSTKSLPAGVPVVINADTLSFEEETGIAIAEGNVEVGFGDKTLRADRIVYNARTREAEFVAHVHYAEKGDEFSFDRVFLNLDTETGLLEKGTIRLGTNNYQISSERFEKTGPRTFVIRKGSLTTCPCDPEPDWRFDIGRSRVTIDGYAVGKDVTFRIRGVPVLWFPYAAFPVKLTRQSGFLLPAYTKSGTKGYSFQLPYYWAINRWSDATVTLDAMSKRGFRPEVEYRFVLNSQSIGEVRGTAYHDKATNGTRSRFFGTNVFRFGQEYTANADWDIPSDDEYYLDLVDTEFLRSARHVASSAFAAKTGENANHALGVVWIKDLQGVREDNTLQRLPEYTGSILPVETGVAGVSASGALQATYLRRQEGESDFRGRGDIALSRTFPLYGSVTATPYVGADFLGTSPSSLSADNQAGRVVPTAGAVLRAELMKDYPDGDRGKYVHAAASGVGFRWIPRVDQSEIPIQDQWSRLGAQNQLSFRVVQRLIRLAPSAGPREVASLELSWALELGRRRASDSPYIDPLSPYERALRDQIDLEARNAKSGNASSDVYGRLRLNPGARTTLTTEGLFDPTAGHFTMAGAGAAYDAGPERKASIEYRVTRGLAEDLLGTIAVRPLRRAGVTAQATYSIHDSRVTDGTATLNLYPRSDCWSIGFGITRKTKPDESSFKITFALKGIGSVGH